MLSPYGGYEDIPEIADLYDNIRQYTSRHDRAFYLDLCREARGEILELGCGTGRVLIPVAQAGCRITGLDNSPYMLERCRAKAAALPHEVQSRITLVQDNMTGFRLDRKFALAIIPFRPLQHIVTVEEQLACLECIRQHLELGGRLAFDVFHPDPLKIGGEPSPDEIEDMPRSDLPDGRSLRRTFRILARRRREQCNDTEVIYYVTNPNGDTQRIVQAFPMRYFYRYELEHLLARTGFQVTALYGDFDRSPFTDNSPELIFVASPVENR
jgi:SAM-dependent methyltransferase